MRKNHLIDNLSVKVQSLEKTLSGNLPLIRNKLVEDLLKGKFESVEKVNEHMALVKKEPIDRYAWFNVITLDFDETFMDNINTENSEFIKYNLLDQIESGRACPPNMMCLAMEDEHRIYIVVCTQHQNAEPLHALINHLISYAYSNFMVSVVAAIGTWTRSPLNIGAAFEETRQILKYRYFKPNVKIMAGKEYTDRENSKKELDDSYLEAFAKALKLRDMRYAEKAIRSFVEELSQGCYNADYAHEKIKELIYQYYHYVKSMNISTREILDDRMLSAFYQFAGIDQLQDWLIEAVRITFRFIEERNRNKNAELIEKIKGYVAEHLEEDLSLNAIAEVFYLSPRYFSRLFKQTTGENFVDFVTRMRMKKAEEMLRNSELNIEQIAMKVNYSNPAYFTKKFKEQYGMTPSQYRNQRLL